MFYNKSESYQYFILYFFNIGKYVDNDNIILKSRLSKYFKFDDLPEYVSNKLISTDFLSLLFSGNYVFSLFLTKKDEILCQKL